MISIHVERMKRELTELALIDQEYNASELPKTLLKMMLNFFVSIKEVFEKFVENNSILLKNCDLIKKSIQEIEQIFEKETDKSVKKLLQNEIRNNSLPYEIIKKLLIEANFKCNYF